MEDAGTRLSVPALHGWLHPRARQHGHTHARAATARTGCDILSWTLGRWRVRAEEWPQRKFKLCASHMGFGPKAEPSLASDAGPKETRLSSHRVGGSSTSSRTVASGSAGRVRLGRRPG